MAERHRPDLSIVIPALNESERLPTTLGALDRYLAGQETFDRVEIIVVDDGSTDRTRDVVEQTRMGSGADLCCRSHAVNRGKGAAVRTGFGASRGAWVLLTDADLAAPIEGFRRLRDASGPADVVIGSRAVDRSLLLQRQPLYRDLMGRTFNFMVRLLVLPGVSDTQCGFKLFPGPVARALASVQRVDGFAYDVELLVTARAWGLRVVEIGVPWGHVEASRVLPGRHSAQMFGDLLKIATRRWISGIPARPECIDEG